MIQVLTYDGKFDTSDDNDFKISSFHEFESFDAFEVNIINLDNKNIWCNNGPYKKRVNCEDDFQSIKIALKSSSNKFLILLPKNYTYYYRLNGSGNLSCELKNMLPELRQDIFPGICDILTLFELKYEHNIISINDHDYQAQFWMDLASEKDGCLYSNTSRRPLGFIFQNIAITTVEAINGYGIKNILKEINFITHKQSVPDWIEGIKMFDDINQIDIIRKNRIIIQDAESEIRQAETILTHNNKLKSILYTSGKELEDTVKDILTDMFGENFSGFYDEKKEDFRATVKGKIILGEIKGVTPNVRLENVSQLEVHYEGFLDDNPDVDADNVKALLIINHQRKKPIYAREPVHERQIKLAQRNGSLIIDTYTLLKMYEKYKKNEYSQEDCFNIIFQNTGLLAI